MDSAKSDYIRTLRRLPLFTDLSDAELAQVAEGVSRLYFEEGTLIFGEGDVCRELLIVEEGTVKIVKSALSGRQQLLGIERKGSSLAEVAVFDGGRQCGRCQTLGHIGSWSDPVRSRTAFLRFLATCDLAN